MADEGYIILGATSCIAIATARRLAKRGCALALVARDETQLDDLAADLSVRGATHVTTVALDLVETADQRAVLTTLATRLETLSGILVFYGLLGDQARAEADTSHALEIIDTNFRSAAVWTLEGAQCLEQSPAPRRTLLGVSSVAGDRGRRSNFVYGAAKGGFSTLLQGLAHKWAAQSDAPRAVAVKLGFVDTPMTEGFDKSGPLWARPDTVARIIERALIKGGPQIYGPWYWRFIMLAIRTTPSFVFNKLGL